MICPPSFLLLAPLLYFLFIFVGIPPFHPSHSSKASLSHSKKPFLKFQSKVPGIFNIFIYIHWLTAV